MAVEKELGLPLHTEALAHFRSQMIGNHEVRECRHENCEVLVVKMPGRRRDGSPYHVWVIADSVEEGDQTMNWSKHRPHRCRKMETNRR